MIGSKFGKNKYYKLIMQWFHFYLNYIRTHLIKYVPDPFCYHEYDHDRQTKCDISGGFYEDHSEANSHPYYTS